MLAARQGATPEEIENARAGRIDGFEAAERAALRFAAQITGDSNAVSDAMFTELSRHFDEGAIVEIAAVAGLFNYFNRFNNALQVPPTR